MFRITDTVKHLIIINVLLYVATFVLKSNGIFLFEEFALFYYKNELFKPWQIVTHMFMHSGEMHIIFNMLALWMFGSAMEQLWGKKKFLFFYFSAGLGAFLVHTLANYIQFEMVYDQLLSTGVSVSDINKILQTGKADTALFDIVPQSDLANFYYAYTLPAVGASGAIMGLLVAFGMTFPNAELMLLFLPIPIKAKYFIPIIIGLDLFSGLTGVSVFSPNNTAYWAHLGGALLGFIMMFVWKKNQFNHNRWS